MRSKGLEEEEGEKIRGYFGHFEKRRKNSRRFGVNKGPIEMIN